MNAHDSEKVVGTLLHEGYTQVETVEAAHYVFYNTCSIRDKAEQKVFNRLQHFKREAGKGKVFAVIGCVAQQEGEKIFERAPHVSLVAGSASYTRLPEMLVQLEAGTSGSRVSVWTPIRLSILLSHGVTILTARTLRSSKVATRAAPIAWCLSPADPNAAAPVRASSRKHRALPIPATPRCNCSARTSTAIAIPRRPHGISRPCSTAWGPSPGSAASASPPRIRGT